MDITDRARRADVAPEREDERRALLNLAYRMLGSLADAEDVVQETYIRWHALDDERRREIASPPAWMTTVATRLCLDVLRSARRRRERYTGTWLPEPLPTRSEWASSIRHHDDGDPAGQITLDESVSMALLVVLETMTPAERVAFVLHDVFRYTFAEIATIVGRTPGAARQLAASARRRVAQARPSGSGRAVEPPTPVVDAFRLAWERGDVEALVRLLDPEVVATVDGGGVVSAAVLPISGARQVAQALVAVLDRHPHLSIVARSVNGGPGLAAVAHGATVAVIAVEVGADAITDVWVVRNPHKLQPWNARIDARRV